MTPAVPQIPAPPNLPAPRLSFYKRMPMWLQWGLPLGLALVSIVLLIVFVNHQVSSAPGVADVTGARARTENKEAYEVMRQQETPHSAHSASDVAPAIALERAIRAWVDGQVSKGALNGPVQSVRCASTGAGTASRVALKCTATAAQVKYSFEGVVEPSAKTVTYCQKIDFPPAVGEKLIPVSSTCT